jgi:hypothetical protein
LQTWHAYVDQYEPHQRKTPVWQALPADQAVGLEMPLGSHFQCVALPLEVTPQANDYDTELYAWSLMRSVVCSSDGWQHWTEYPQHARLMLGGTRQMPNRSETWLRERTQDGSTHNTLIALRAEEPRRDATTGPPQIIVGVEVEPD